MIGELIGTDWYGDVAFVRLPAPIDAEIFQISRELVEVGEPVVAVGHPGMIGNWVTMAGVVAHVTTEYSHSARLGRMYRDVNTSAPLSQGASGSAITRLDGVVVAINSRSSFSEDWKPLDDGFPHTHFPRADDGGGVSSASIIRAAGEFGVELQLVD
jgi:S1-C subfamily serine protease